MKETPASPKLNTIDNQDIQSSGMVPLRQVLATKYPIYQKSIHFIGIKRIFTSPLYRNAMVIGLLSGVIFIAIIYLLQN